MFFKRKNSFSEEKLSIIIQGCIEQKPKAQRALVESYYSYTKNVASRYGGSPEEIEEIVDDSFIKVFQNLHKYDERQSFKAWIKRITVNTAIDYYRKNQSIPYFESVENLSYIDTQETIVERLSGEEILGLVQNLPPSYRMVFSMYVVEGYSHKEIGEMLGYKETTSKSNLRVARQKLQELIKIHYPDIYSDYTVD